jgi:tetraacyldisaccharide 4'-kinase
VVVGNISLGGTGKTPLLLALAARLRQRGRRPGIVSRGYGGNPGPEPVLVTPAHSAAVVGDEPLLLARASGCPVVVCPDRCAAVAWLLAHSDCDLVLSDDGLQHYRLHRDFEIVVIDGVRGLGNGRCLPAGPLREPPARLAAVDAVVVNGGSYRLPGGAALRMALRPLGLRQLATTTWVAAPGLPADWGAARRVHAVAAIGHPQRFADSLRALGLTVDLRALPDHHPLGTADLEFGDALPVVITAKDAVKCAGIADPRIWVLEVAAELAESDWAVLLAGIESLV